MSVSSRTPRATAKPISANATTGSVPRTAKVPASTSPADVITPPVAASPTSAPRRVPTCLGLLVDAGHQEDVVVDAERDQEHEDEQRERRVGAGEAEHVPEDQRAQPERRAERQHHGADQHQRRDSARSSSTRMSRTTTSSTTGMISVVVGPGARSVSSAMRGAAADLGVRARHGVHRRADPVDGVLGGLAVRRVARACPGGTRSRPL